MDRQSGSIPEYQERVLKIAAQLVAPARLPIVHTGPHPEEHLGALAEDRCAAGCQSGLALVKDIIFIPMLIPSVYNYVQFLW